MSRATGRSLRMVAFAPYHLTLYEYLQLLEAERIEGVLDRLHAVNEAALMSLAFNEPKKLRDEYDAAADAAGLLPTADEARAKGLKVIEMMAAIDARQAAALAEAATDGR